MADSSYQVENVQGKWNESYRMLGVNTMDRLCRDCSGDFLELTRHILANHLDRSVPEWLAKLMRSAGGEGAGNAKA